MANSTSYIFRNNLKFYRNKQKYTQEKLSEICGISTDYLSQIEFLDCNKVYIHIQEPNLWPVNSEGSTGTFTINAGSENIIKSINNIDRTDSKLIKIIELPYPPFNFKNTVPEGWELKNGELVYNQLLDTELECDLRNSNLPNRIVVSKVDVLAFKNKDINN